MIMRAEQKSEKGQGIRVTGGPNATTTMVWEGATYRGTGVYWLLGSSGMAGEETNTARDSERTCKAMPMVVCGHRVKFKKDKAQLVPKKS